MGARLQLSSLPLPLLRCHPFSLRPANVLNKSDGVMPRCSSRPPDYDGSWDSNAESWRTAGRFRSQKTKKAGKAGGDAGFFKDSRGWRWWSDDDDDDDDDAELDEEDDEMFEQDPWDAFWFFKVLKSFGWFLPPIIISTILATGPKAFLVAMALPLGQSALSFAADKLWGKPQTKQRNRAGRAKRSKKKPFTRKASYSTAQMEEEDLKVRDDQSWAAAGNVSNKGEGSGRPEPSFGGWDELERGRRSAARKRSAASRGVGGSKVGLSRGGRRKKEAPLLMRLLIAVFPFLGSWTNLL